MHPLTIGWATPRCVTMLSECLNMDPLGNPIGFWAIFGVLIVIVILLAAGPLFYLVSLVRAARRDRPDPEQAARARTSSTPSRRSSVGSTRS